MQFAYSKTVMTTYIFLFLLADIFDFLIYTNKFEN